jgi:hypothetical protein
MYAATIAVAAAAAQPGQPSERRGELGGHGRADQPLAAADRDAEDDRAGSGHPERVPGAVRRWSGQFGYLPGWEAPRLDLSALARLGYRSFA